VELVETLNGMVDQLINENRRLKRELSRLSDGAPAEADGTSEKTLRTLHRKVQQAVTSAPTRRRRASTAPATPRRRGPRREASPQTGG
jgi:hypothetical protein